MENLPGNNSAEQMSAVPVALIESAVNRIFKQTFEG